MRGQGLCCKLRPQLDLELPEVFHPTPKSSTKDHVSHISYMKINTLVCSYFINNVTPSPTTSHQEAGMEDSHALKLLTELWKVGGKKNMSPSQKAECVYEFFSARVSQL